MTLLEFCEHNKCSIKGAMEILIRLSNEIGQAMPLVSEDDLIEWYGDKTFNDLIQDQADTEYVEFCEVGFSNHN